MSAERVNSLTHDFYKYPARFPPSFASAAIEAFTEPGETVLDPFVGGGTSAVESRVAGRRFIGCDLNGLSLFASRAKTTLYSDCDFDLVRSWASDLNQPRPRDSSYRELVGRYNGQLRNLHFRDTWRLRDEFVRALATFDHLPSASSRQLARCLVLRSAQRAVDGRSRLGSPMQFREDLWKRLELMYDGAAGYRRRVRHAERVHGLSGRRMWLKKMDSRHIASLLKTSAQSPKLILTSPPYPGVHMVYHRWQLKGGKETPAPFLIVDQPDELFEGSYLMHARRRDDLRTYLKSTFEIFASIRRAVSKPCVLVNLIAFSDPRTQLPRYLETMHRAGWAERRLPIETHSCDGRLWRPVPNRKWYAQARSDLASGKETAMFFRPI